ncbi:MAG: TonB-dependent receptor plug domain-containing protein [Rhodothermales bacterium]
MYRTSLARLAGLGGVGVADVLELVPGAHIQTNSRGEHLVYIRGAGERQVSLLLDGAPLNIPWDNRMDLDMLPASVLGGMTVVRGIASSSFGPNTAGGVIQLETRSVLDPEGLVEMEVRAGTGQERHVHGLVSGSGRAWSWIGMASLLGRSGLPVPDNAELPFNQAGRWRTNTDMHRGTVFGRVSWSNRLAFSILHVDGRKGVAPEGHLPAESGAVRYWRYPDWTFSTLIAGGRPLPGWDLSLWWTRFGQVIHDFPDGNYAAPDGRQQDRDRSVGFRSRTQSTWRGARVTWSLFGTGSTHHQRDMPLPEGSVPGLNEQFGQILLSSGVDVAGRLGSAMRWGAGGSLDAQFMPVTGEKPRRDPFLDWTAHATWQYRHGDHWWLQAAAGKKARFPTLRELFGEALHRFVVNPGLRPESVWMGEWTLGYARDIMGLEVTAFHRRSRHTIDQEWVQTLEGTKRRRVNLDGSHTTGVESVVGISMPGRVRMDAHASVMWHRARQDGASVRMIEKPERLGRVDVERTFLQRWAVRASVSYRGPSWGMSPSPGTDRLEGAATLDGQVRWRSVVSDAGTFVDIRIGVRNILDAVVEPQTGLPAPGRSLHAGLSVTL